MKLKNLFLTALAFTATVAASAKEIELLNVSYDPTRELDVDFNVAFTK